MSTQIPGLYIMETSEKGRGVYSSIHISKGDVIESAPVIICSSVERKILHDTRLHDYYFLWQDDQCAIALGYGSLYNHSEKPNAEFIFDYEDKSIDFEAIRDIEPGEEILINYQDDEASEFKIWFDVV